MSKKNDIKQLIRDMESKFVRECEWKKWNGLSPEMRACLLKHSRPPRHRPLMGPFYDHKTGNKYYIRKKDLSYFELRKTFPPKFLVLEPPKHVFAAKHYLFAKPAQEHIKGYIIAGSAIAAAAAIVIFELYIWLTY